MSENGLEFFSECLAVDPVKESTPSPPPESEQITQLTKLLDDFGDCPQLEKLQELLKLIDNLGWRTPDDCWLQAYKAKGQQRYYTYYKLMSKSAIFPKKKNSLSCSTSKLQ